MCPSVKKEAGNAPGMRQAHQIWSQGGGEAAGSCRAANPATRAEPDAEPQLWLFFPRPRLEVLRVRPDVRNLNSVRSRRFWRIHPYIFPKGLGGCLAEHRLGQRRGWGGVGGREVETDLGFNSSPTEYWPHGYGPITNGSSPRSFTRKMRRMIPLLLEWWKDWITIYKAQHLEETGNATVKKKK